MVEPRAERSEARGGENFKERKFVYLFVPQSRNSSRPRDSTYEVMQAK